MSDVDYICPLADIDRRLEDAHRIWHKTVDSYFDPDEFRVNGQHLIQTLRTVTFVLQSNKAKIPGFEEWYRAEQEGMRADPQLRWLVDSRNNIEKKGDLRKKSFVTADIIASYLEDGPSETVEAHLFEGPNRLMDRIPRFVLEKHVLVNGVLRIRRSWVHETLPESEVTEALASLYGKLSELVGRAHLQAGLMEPRFSEDHEHGKWLNGRLPCMVGHENPRSFLLNLRDHSTLTMSAKSVKYDQDAANKAEKRYGSISQLSSKPVSAMEKAAYYFNLARTVFLRDRNHSTIAILLAANYAKVVSMLARDRQEKYLNSRHLALEVKRSGSDAVVFIGEAWTTAFDAAEPYRFPADAPNREEILFLTFADCKGEIISLSATIKRKIFGGVALSETRVTDGGSPYFLAPVFEVWGLPAPDNPHSDFDNQHQ